MRKRPRGFSLIQVAVAVAFVSTPIAGLLLSQQSMRAAQAMSQPLQGPRHPGAPGFAPTPGAAPNLPAPHTEPAPAATQGAPLTEPLESAATGAAAVHGAVVMRDWPAAATHLVAVRGSLSKLTDTDLRTVAMRRRLARLRAQSAIVERAVARRDFVGANAGAYRLVAGMLDAMTAMAAIRGGGGGPPAPAGATSMGPAPVEHLRQAYPEVLMAHASLLRQDPADAKQHLEVLRMQLAEAQKAGPEPGLAIRIDDLNKRRWRIVASLQDRALSTRNSAALTMAYARAMYAAGQLGGGGGAPPRRVTAPQRYAPPSVGAKPVMRRAISTAHDRPARLQVEDMDRVPYDKRHGR